MSETDPAPSDEPDMRARLMEEVAQQMDAIERDYGEDFRINRVITLVEVVQPSGEVELRVRAGQLPWVTLGMLRWAAARLENAVPGIQPPGPDDPAG